MAGTVLRWSGPDEDAREAAVRYWKRVIQITVMVSSVFAENEAADEVLRYQLRTITEYVEKTRRG